MGVEMTIATCLHRLDQLTRPTFDRATVEELLGEIMRLRSEEHRNKIANELAWRDSKIDEQQEELDAQGDEIEELNRRIEMLLDANTALAKQFDAKLSKPPRMVECDQLGELPNPTEVRRLMGVLEHRQQLMPIASIGQVLNGPPPVTSMAEAKAKLAETQKRLGSFVRSPAGRLSE